MLVVVFVDSVSYWTHVICKFNNSGGIRGASEHWTMGFPVDVVHDGHIPRVSFGHQGEKGRTPFSDSYFMLEPVCNRALRKMELAADMG